MFEREFKRTFFYSVKRKIVGVGERILVHTASILVAVGASKSIYDPTFHSSMFGSVLIAFMMYVGLVSLFPAGNPRRTDWFVPFVMACVLGVVCYTKLLPWQFIVFWMGAQSWCVRLVSKKDRQSEWVTAPWVLLCAAMYFSRYAELSATPVLYFALPAITVAGFITTHGVNKLFFFPFRKKQIANIATRLDSFLTNKRLPLPFEDPVRLLVNNSRLVVKAVPNLDDNMVTPIMAMGIVANKLSILVAGDSSRWTTEGERVLQAIGMLNEDFDRRLTNFDTVAVEEEEIEEQVDPKVARCDELLELTTRIVLQKPKLPQHLHQPLDNIRLTTRGIVDSMLSDPFDFEPGEKFLNRYLPALEKLVEEYIRLYHNVDPGHEDVDKVLLRTENIITRLEETFKKERAHLLRNDAIDLNAELASLDTLLRIHGR